MKEAPGTSILAKPRASRTKPWPREPSRPRPSHRSPEPPTAARAGVAPRSGRPGSPAPDSGPTPRMLPGPPPRMLAAAGASTDAGSAAEPAGAEAATASEARASPAATAAAIAAGPRRRAPRRARGAVDASRRGRMRPISTVLFAVGAQSVHHLACDCSRAELGALMAEHEATGKSELRSTVHLHPGPPLGVSRRGPTASGEARMSSQSFTTCLGTSPSTSAALHRRRPGYRSSLQTERVLEPTPCAD